MRSILLGIFASMFICPPFLASSGAAAEPKTYSTCTEKGLFETSDLIPISAILPAWPGHLDDIRAECAKPEDINVDDSLRPIVTDYLHIYDTLSADPDADIPSASRLVAYPYAAFLFLIERNDKKMAGRLIRHAAARGEPNALSFAARHQNVPEYRMDSQALHAGFATMKNRDLFYNHACFPMYKIIFNIYPKGYLAWERDFAWSYLNNNCPELAAWIAEESKQFPSAWQAPK